MGEMVKFVNMVPLASTLDIWKELGVDHSAIVQLVKKYEEDFQSIRTFQFLKSKSSGGRPSEYTLLDEVQATFLITLMRNSSKTVPFKLKITNEFYRMKRELIRIASQNQNAQWLEARHAGKETRCIATDVIKQFIDYATKQGSKNAGRYYANISKMENQALFLLEQKYKNLRDALDIHQLSTVKSADMIVMKALADGMTAEMDYKDIYKLAKVRVEGFAEVIGRTLIPSSQLQIEGSKHAGRIKALLL